MPRVTVIIATYNWSSVLPYSIGSVLRQTFTDYELLVVGDGCTDDSEAVVGAIGDPRIRWINLPKNSGHQSGPNNEGLRQARGDVIAYLGHDDLWLPHHLEILVSALDDDADFAHGLVINIGPDGRFVWPTIHRPQHGFFAPPTGMTHRQRVMDDLGGWRDYRGLKEMPEADLWQRARAAGFRFAFVPRLTAIKFPAGLRKNSYRDRPCHEQAAWTARIEREPDLEARELVKLIVYERPPSGVTYSEVVQAFIRETQSRIRRRFQIPRGRGQTVDEVQRFKGLKENR